ncbi:collectin-11-like [Branchiostoma lanceolatum]|uniref:collectin-11-like n=1 Tax=Branchiostoma lanceolatum TaxID=7740 RepID=UPI0034516E6A
MHPGPPTPLWPPIPPGEREAVGPAGTVGQDVRDGALVSPIPTKPPEGKGPVGSQDLPEPVGSFGPPGLQGKPTYPPERPQTNIRGKSDKVSCKGGYTVFRGICYKVFKTYQTFNEAAATCRADGGTLAMPRDAQINDFLISLYQKSVNNDPLWFGLHDRREEGKFEWVDGSPLGEYNSWGLQ